MATQLRQIVVWHDVMSNIIASHRMNNYISCSTEGLTEELKEMNISVVIHCQRRGKPDNKRQLINLCVLLVPIMKFLISKKKRKAEPELQGGNQELHQDSDLELKSLRKMYSIKRKTSQWFSLNLHRLQRRNP